ncbi:MAG: DUF5317 family protein [Coriobacteriia bacterium]
MLVLEVVMVGLLAALVSGGRIRNLIRERLWAEGVLLTVLPFQIIWPLATRHFGIRCSWSVAAWLLMMLILFLVLVANSRHRPVLLLAALGVAANMLVIGLNGAMPVSISAISEIGATRSSARALLAQDCLYRELSEDTALSLFADVIPIPGPRWQRSVVSVGDLLLAVGLGGWIFVACRGHRSE